MQRNTASDQPSTHEREVFAYENAPGLTVRLVCQGAMDGALLMALEAYLVLQRRGWRDAVRLLPDEI